MKKLVTFCVAITLLLTQVAGQSTGTIKGKVFDEGNREALFGAMVVVTTGQVNIGCQTDPDGNYIIKPLNSGIYTIKISSMGYQTTIVKDIIVNP
ncbi:MAG TPA: carboxypeptidase-like regulatory domain-containing protein, partial [Bacteroidales bacterium]|nr:carboxypeptidase-like regulatory domain-containing protein [Bacteroidales bacterium]